MSSHKVKDLVHRFAPVAILSGVLATDDRDHRHAVLRGEPAPSQAKSVPIFDAQWVRIPVQVDVLLVYIAEKFLIRALYEVVLLQNFLLCVDILDVVDDKLDVRVVLHVKVTGSDDSKSEV